MCWYDSLSVNAAVLEDLHAVLSFSHTSLLFEDPQKTFTNSCVYSGKSNDDVK